MSATLSLSSAYGSFFWGCTKFAVSPYTNTFFGIANPKDARFKDIIPNVAAAAVICGVLTFVVPVLPVLASITFSLASIAMTLAVASMFVAYPLALIADAFTPHNHSNWNLDSAAF